MTGDHTWPSGQRIHYRNVADGVGEVHPDDIVKGHEIARGEYVLLDDEEVSAVRIESRRTLELVRFVAMAAIPSSFYERPCYAIPTDALAADHLIGAGEKLLRAMCDAGQEGIVSKRIDAPNRAARTRPPIRLAPSRAV